MTQHFSHNDRPFCASLELAAEHCQYERGRGRSPAQVIRAIGRTPPTDADWNDARRAVARAWVEMNLPSSTSTSET